MDLRNVLAGLLGFFSKIFPPGQPAISENQLLIPNTDEMHLIELFSGFLICLC